jgi:hypothetical protein
MILEVPVKTDLAGPMGFSYHLGIISGPNCIEKSILYLGEIFLI